MACQHKYRPLPTTYPSGRKSVAMKRCVRCGKTVETYLALKITVGIAILVIIIGLVISYLDSLPAN